jgi:hypothetical protein
MPPVSDLPRPLAVSAIPILFPLHFRREIWALIGLSNVPYKVTKQSRRAIAGLQSSLVTFLRDKGLLDQELLEQVAEIVTAEARTKSPYEPHWRGGLTWPMTWGLFHVSWGLRHAAQFASGPLEYRLRRAADAADDLINLLDALPGGSATGFVDPDTDAPPPVPSPKQIETAWVRFELAMNALGGAFPVLVVVEPAWDQLGAPAGPALAEDAEGPLVLPFANAAASADHAG